MGRKGLFGVESKDKYGMIDSKGKIVVETKYFHLGTFENGLAVIESYQNGGFKSGFINDSGKVVINPQYSMAINTGGLVYVRKNGKAGFLDKKGKIVIKLQYS